MATRSDASSVDRYGDADIAAIGGLLGDPGRCRMLLALDDGRALPASRLAAEAGVAPATASSHLNKLRTAGLLTVEPHGRHRYYRLAGPDIGNLLEIMGRLAPPAPVRSLRQSKRADALRRARTCYDHLAGRLGVELMTRLIQAGHLTGGDGRHHPELARSDPLAGFGHDVDYRLTPLGHSFLTDFGVVLPRGRQAIRYCVDWSEQRHHLAGGLGRGLLDRLLAMDWIRRAPDDRAVRITDLGRDGLASTFALTPPG